jgi:Transcriptional regulator, AbiEi antitoxin
MTGLDDRSQHNRAVDRPGHRGLAELGARQHGVVATWQLKRAGYSRSTISSLANASHLHRIYRGVYAVGHRSLTTPGRRMAAVLACGPDALLSHATATCST